MSRRRLLIGFATLLVVVVVAMLPSIYRKINPPAVSRERFERLKKGMSREEVEAIIGVPPGTYETERRISLGLFPIPPGEIWNGDEGIIDVCFDDTGHAVYLSFFNADEYSIPAEVGLLDRLRAWLKV